ncbi:hypothetical protein SHIRM173S_00978 [Streptomyces hirsutus]
MDKVTAPGVNLDAAAWAIDVTGLVTGWTDGANINHGLVLRRADTAPSTGGGTFHLGHIHGRVRASHTAVTA